MNTKTQKETKKQTRGVFFWILGIISSLGVILAFFSTHWGAGLTPDSASYIAAARSLVEGSGLSVPFSRSGGEAPAPLIFWPPGFPLVLSALGWLGVDPLLGARFLNVSLLGANITLVGLSLMQTTHSRQVSIFGALLALTSYEILTVHSFAWSEPLFIFFSFLGLLLLAIYLDGGRRGQASKKILVLGSLAIGLAFLTRYAGGALVATGVMAILLLPRRSRRERIKDVSLFLGISCAFMLLWLARNYGLVGNLTGRKLSFHLMPWDELRGLLLVISSWLIPERVHLPAAVRLGISGIAALTVVGLAVASRRRDRTQQANSFRAIDFSTLPALMAIFVFFYMGVCYLHGSFFSRGPFTFNSRILSPVMVAALIFILSFNWRGCETPAKGGWVKRLLVILALLFMTFQSFKTALWAARAYRSGLGYASKRWKESGMIQELKRLPHHSVIYTNGQEIVYHFSGLSALHLPLPNTSEGLDKLAARLRKEKGIAVFFIEKRTPPYPLQDELERRLPIRLIDRLSDPAIFYVGGEDRSQASSRDRSNGLG